MSFTVHWMRKGIRLHDNPALTHTLARLKRTAQPRLLIVWVLDPYYAESASVGGARWRFLFESLLDVRQSISARGGRLAVLRGPLIPVMQRLREAGMDTLSFEKDFEDYSISRDKQIAEWAADTGKAAGGKQKAVAVEATSGHTLYPIDLSHKVSATYHSFLKWCEKQAAVADAAPLPDSLPPSPEGPVLDRLLVDLELSDQQLFDLGLHKKGEDLSPMHPHSPLIKLQAAHRAGGSEHAAAIEIAAAQPSAKKRKKGGQTTLSFAPAAAAAAAPAHASAAPSSSGGAAASVDDRPEFVGHSYFVGGETEGLRRMEEYLADAAAVRAFEKPNTSPAALVPSTTTLSPYLKFGVLGPRQFYHALRRVIDGHKGASQPPVSLIGQLLWREYFTHTAAHTPHFDRMVGNPLCKQIAWIEGEQESEYLKAWEQAATGYPFVDALMTQLRQHGWMHHLGRHMVACFLTRGDLYVSWERGRDVFDRLLVDSDPALNNANWQWLSASSFFFQYMRVYSPVAFAKKWKAAAFIRHFLPVLQRMPDKYVYEPWTAPLSVQQKAGCIVGQDYPRPIVEHAAASQANIQRHKAAYAGLAQPAHTKPAEPQKQQLDTMDHDKIPAAARAKKTAAATTSAAASASTAAAPASKRARGLKRSAKHLGVDDEEASDAEDDAEENS